MASRAGLASGLVMGVGFVIGAIGVPINGAIGDAIGLAWFLPREEEVEGYAVAVSPAT